MKGGIYIFELRKNPGLKANVISMYKSYFQSEGFFRPRIAENVTISGKLKEHTVDIYFEFIQMNNLERTVIKVIAGTKVTENDMWEFANVLKDLHFFAKGIIYYDDRVSSGAKKVAELTNIDLKKFDLLDEVIKSALSAIKVMLPDEEVIGDPFWVVMGTEQDSDKNTGNYEMVNDSILLFISKKQAINYCSKIKNSAKVFGISQNHLKVLVSLQEKGMCPGFGIAFPEFEQVQENSILYYQIPHKRFKKFYLRGDNNE